MHKTRFRPNMFGKRGQKRDDIMFNLALNLVNARNIKAAALAYGLGSAGTMPSSTMASMACVSISSQIEKRLSASHKVVILGRA